VEPLATPIRQTLLTERSADLRDAIHSVLYFLWRRWKFVLAVAAIALLVAEVWLATQPPSYTASAQVIIDPIGEKVDGADATSQSTLDSLTLDNQIAIVRSTELLRRVVEKENLVDDPEFGARPSQRLSWLGSLKSNLAHAIEAAGQSAVQAVDGLEAPVPPQLVAKRTSEKGIVERAVEIIRFHFAGAVRTVGQFAIGTAKGLAGAARAEATVSIVGFDKVAATTGLLAQATTAKRVGAADVISIIVISTDPTRAAQLANAVAEAYLLDPLYARLEAGQREAGWLNERLPDLRARLRESEEAVVAFREAHNLVEGEQNITLSQEQVAKLNARLVAAHVDAAEAKNKVDLLQNLETRGGDAGDLPGAINSPLISGLRTQLADVSLREAGLAARLGEANPEVVKLRAERAREQSAIAAEVRTVGENVRNQYFLALAQEQSLKEILGEATAQSNLANKTSVELHDLEETATVNRRLFEEFLKRSSSIHELSGDQARLGRIIAPATPPATSSSPRKLVILPIAALLGLALGVGGAWAKEVLDAGFTTSREAEELLGLPLLGSIIRIAPRASLISGCTAAFPRSSKPNPRLSEAVRTLGMSIQMLEVERPPKVVQVTSALPGEGKTTTSIMLATSFSEAGLKTLIMDTDLRNPSVSRYFRFDNDAGLVDLLLDPSKAEEAVHFNATHGLWVLPAGVDCENLSNLLTFDRLRRLIERYRNIFDCVVVDSPPVGPVVDARLISNIVDKVVFVVKWGKTHRNTVYQNVKLLPDRSKIAGLVFNFVDERRAKRYGASGYLYG
jgi:succinoglycan biosynthesis transport protein ExoP